MPKAPHKSAKHKNGCGGLSSALIALSCVSLFFNWSGILHEECHSYYSFHTPNGHSDHLLKEDANSPHHLERMMVHKGNRTALSLPEKTHDDAKAWISLPIIRNQSALCPSWRSTTRYSPRFFLGGGKAGSTGLWHMLLSGTPVSGFGPNSSDFIGFALRKDDRVGKELCFGRSSTSSIIGRPRRSLILPARNNNNINSTNSSSQPKNIPAPAPLTKESWERLFQPSSPMTNIGLDCCPQGTEKIRICNLWKLFPCEIRFLMLVRDPADRALSWFNDKSSSHQNDPKKAESYSILLTRRKSTSSSHRNFQLADILTDAIDDCGVDPRAILVVDTDGLKESPTIAQGIMDAVNDHYGLPRMHHAQKISNRAAAIESERHMKATLSPATKRIIRTELESQTKEFLQLLQTPGKILSKSLPS